MTREYGSHADFMDGVKSETEERLKNIEAELKKAFANVIRAEQIEVVVFSELSAEDLAKAIENHPVVLKPLLSACNIGGRAIERDLQLKNIDTYGRRIKAEHAKIIAGYISPFLPPSMPLPALIQLDRAEFIDKEIRKRKGRWEQKIRLELSESSKKDFHKRKFSVGNQKFEIDAAYPKEGGILLGVDIKRIEARKDIHKRCDEIANKALKLKEIYPRAKFGAVIYYPFIEEHANIRDRLQTESIDSVVFASESKESIANAVRLLLGKVELK